MTETGLNSGDERFLVLTPTGRDAALTCSLLEKSGLSCLSCKDIEELCERTEHEGAAGLLIAEEVLVSSALTRLRALLARQEPWSDLPILLFTGQMAAPRARVAMPLAPLGNVSLLDRPVRPMTMVSAAKTALRARRRQYTARSELSRQQQAVTLRDQFLAMLGHELRNPLSAIAMAIAAMDDQNTAEHRVLRRQAAHLTRLVDDLLDVSRVTTGKAVLKLVPLDLVGLVRACLHAMKVTVQAQGLELRYQAPAEAVVVEGDPVRLEQAVTNLVANAAKYTPRGGSIEVSVSREQDQAVLVVKDDGVGISAEMLPRVFDLFTQAEATLERAKGGMGIGLTLVRSLVEQHQGHVEADSAGLGKGSVFTVRLPFSDRAEVEQSRFSEPAPQPQAKAGCDVLIIEDNADSREMLAMLLARDGHCVYEACDGQTGIEEAVKRKPKALLVDIGLPGLDGYGVAKRVRELLGAEVYMIALTGYGQPEDKRRAIEAGFDVHFTKPVDVKAINALLSQADTRRCAE